MSDHINDGGPAFPIADFDNQTFTPKTVDEMRRLLSGMSLRDHFAAKAMQGICAHSDTWGLTGEQIAGAAFGIADAMIRVRGAA